MTTLADQGFLTVDGQKLEYRMIGPRPDQAPTLVVLSGDLTQRARPAQFRAARAFSAPPVSLAAIAGPVPAG